MQHVRQWKRDCPNHAPHMGLPGGPGRGLSPERVTRREMEKAGVAEGANSDRGALDGVRIREAVTEQ